MDKIDSYKIPDMVKLNKSPKKTIFQICENLIFFLIFYPIVLNILEMVYKNGFIFTHGIALIIYVVIINFMRIKIRKHFLAIALNLVLFFIFILIPFPNYERILYGIYAALALINSIRKFYKIDYNFYSISILILGEALLSINLLVSYALNNSFSKHLTLFCAVMLSLVFLFYSSRSKYGLLINSENKVNSNNTVILSSRKLLISIFSAFLIFMCFTLLITNRINSGSDHALVNALTTLFSPNSLLNSNKNTNKNILKKFRNQSMFKNNEKVPQNIKYRNNSFLYKYFYLILSLILILAILFFLFKMIKFLINTKIEDQQNVETETTFLNEDFRKDLSNIVPKFNFNLSDKERLRRYYKKLIKRYRKKGLDVKDSSTPMELKDRILNLTGNNIDDITKIYNKSRYSSYEPTKQDIDKFKKIAK